MKLYNLLFVGSVACLLPMTSWSQDGRSCQSLFASAVEGNQARTFTPAEIEELRLDLRSSDAAMRLRAFNRLENAHTPEVNELLLHLISSDDAQSASYAQRLLRGRRNLDSESLAHLAEILTVATSSRANVPYEGPRPMRFRFGPWSLSGPRPPSASYHAQMDSMNIGLAARSAIQVLGQIQSPEATRLLMSHLEANLSKMIVANQRLNSLTPGDPINQSVGSGYGIDISNARSQVEAVLPVLQARNLTSQEADRVRTLLQQLLQEPGAPASFGAQILSRQTGVAATQTLVSRLSEAVNKLERAIADRTEAAGMSWRNYGSSYIAERRGETQRKVDEAQQELNAILTALRSRELTSADRAAIESLRLNRQTEAYGTELLGRIPDPAITQLLINQLNSDLSGFNSATRALEESNKLSSWYYDRSYRQEAIQRDTERLRTARSKLEASWRGLQARPLIEADRPLIETLLRDPQTESLGREMLNRIPRS